MFKKIGKDVLGLIRARGEGKRRRICWSRRWIDKKRGKGEQRLMEAK